MGASSWQGRTLTGRGMSMKVPKYIEKKIRKRAMLQGAANVLQEEIEDWCAKHNIELEYSGTHICLYTEPGIVAIDTIERIEKHNAE